LNDGYPLLSAHLISCYHAMSIIYTPAILAVRILHLRIWIRTIEFVHLWLTPPPHRTRVTASHCDFVYCVKALSVCDSAIESSPILMTSPMKSPNHCQIPTPSLNLTLSPSLSVRICKRLEQPVNCAALHQVGHERTVSRAFVPSPCPSPCLSRSSRRFQSP
jgi:hypothetical protein